jgi:hypothetical protein
MTVTAILRRLDAQLGDLIERHEGARELSEFERYADDPVGFITEVLGGKPWKRQIEIANAVRDSSLVLVRSCNAAGKDWIAAQLALWWVYSHGGLVLLTGPTERQVVEIVMGEVARAFLRARALPGEMYRTALRLGRADRAGILSFTSTEASKLTGFHAPRVMAILTEAQGCEDFAWEGLLACATGSEDRLLAVGNPLSPSGRFFAASRSKTWRSLRISAVEHPNVIEDREVIPGGVTRRFVQTIADEYGEGSSIYQARVLGEFPDEQEDALCRRSWLEAAARQHQSGELAAEAIGQPSIVAIDPARYGPDKTVVAVSRGPVVERIEVWGRKDTMETTGLLIEQLRQAGVTPRRSAEGDEYVQQLAAERALQYGHRAFCSDLPAVGLVIVDEVGLGAAVIDRLQELGYAVEGFNGGRAPEWVDAREKFLNLRAEAFWTLRRLLEDGQIGLPYDELLFDELTTIRWRPNSAGRIQIEQKDRLKQRLGRSPDRADAVAMAMHAWDQERELNQPYDPRSWPPYQK